MPWEIFSGLGAALGKAGLAILARLPVPSRWKRPAMIITLPGPFNPEAFVARRRDHIQLEISVALELESEEHQRRIVVRDAEIVLWRWPNPVRRIHVPCKSYMPRDSGKLIPIHSTALELAPLEKFDGFFMHGIHLPDAPSFPINWHAKLVLRFRGFGAACQRLRIDWTHALMRGDFHQVLNLDPSSRRK